MHSLERIGRYRLERRLGSGAFGTVWLAHDDQLEAPVAVKVLAENWSHRLDVRDRFLSEARLLRRADSNRVVQVYDIGELPDGRPYFVMEYADAGTLADLLAEGPLPVPDALRLTALAARGTAALHDAGIVHRDIKPSNVLLRTATDGSRRLLLGDLGLAKSLAQASGLTLAAGSAGYQPPEQAEPGAGIDARADVYSLGAVGYELLTGTVPGAPGRIVRPDRLRPDLDEDVVRTLMRALEPDRERRWPGAREFAEELERLAGRGAAGPAGRGPTMPGPGTAPPDGRGLYGAGQEAPPWPGQGPDAAGQAPAVPADRMPYSGGQASPNPTGSGLIGSGQGPQGSPDRGLDRAGQTPAVPADRSLDGDGPASSSQAGHEGHSARQEAAAPPDRGPHRTGQASGAPVPRRLDGIRKRLGVVALAVAAVLAAGVAAVLVTLVNRGSPADEVRVADATGRVTAEVPASWGRQLRDSGWNPKALGLRDGQEPGLAVADDLAKWPDLSTPVNGVFIGLSEHGDVADKVNALAHAGCHYAGSHAFSGAGWKGRTRTWTDCSGGGSVSETALARTGGAAQPQVYVQVREHADRANDGTTAATDRVLRSLRIA
ncbi:hypothetical protein GCM10010121_004310 [Streptomyces brasiliensis]|uniref:non-specific serine/threonine protein kinase n=1 Tax=Streptomyces brasiliensis TaxID=1954 RepID=A0A917K1A1_9ACTN|nr:serine/threonine-protein kinase [Streptomyces brasiliensis]GGI97126.1 hypothetical protein GCM10010121_004310 [Streptomyces brasiliensis]